MSNHWIQTYTGKAFNFESPVPDMVCIEDVAHALAHINRFTGHLPVPYSVAQHSVLVSQQLPPPELRLQGLLHDAHEAYVGDVSRPLKRMPGMEPYRALEQRVWYVVARALGVPPTLDPAVKEADMRMLATEKLLFGQEFKTWDLPFKPYPIAIMPSAWDEAKAQFLEEYEQLCK